MILYMDCNIVSMMDTKVIIARMTGKVKSRSVKGRDAFRPGSGGLLPETVIQPALMQIVQQSLVFFRADCTGKFREGF